MNWAYIIAAFNNNNSSNPETVACRWSSVVDRFGQITTENVVAAAAEHRKIRHPSRYDCRQQMSVVVRRYHQSQQTMTNDDDDDDVEMLTENVGQNYGHHQTKLTADWCVVAT